MSHIEDPRRKQSEELAFRAERAERAQDEAQAQAFFAQAAALEEEVGKEVPISSPRLKGIFAISATALWKRAGRWSDVSRTALSFLAQPDGLLPDTITELRSLLATARNHEALATELLAPPALPDPPTQT
jgi:hypothetical protein